MRRFIEAMKRKELVQEYKENFKNTTQALDLNSIEELLKGQNCKFSEE
jgi:hypothetical protein